MKRRVKLSENEKSVYSPEDLVLKTLKSSIYPDVSDSVIRMILEYCRCRKLDPFMKPVHVVKIKDNKKGIIKETIWPSIELYRIQASRSNNYAGLSKPIFGPTKIYNYTFKDKDGHICKKEVEYPEWVEMTAKKIVQGVVCEFSHIERWVENVNLGNSIWFSRPYAQLCVRVESQILRKFWPECTGGQLTYEEINPDGSSLISSESINIETGEISDNIESEIDIVKQKISQETLVKLDDLIQKNNIPFSVIGEWLVSQNASALKDLSEEFGVNMLNTYKGKENVK